MISSDHGEQLTTLPKMESTVQIHGDSRILNTITPSGACTVRIAYISPPRDIRRLYTDGITSNEEPEKR
jgi:hypothetical protein